MEEVCIGFASSWSLSVQRGNPGQLSKWEIRRDLDRHRHSGDCHQSQLCTPSEHTCISPATPALMMMMMMIMTMITSMIVNMMMMMKTMEIVIKAYVYFPSDSCTNGLCRSQTRGVISLEGAFSHIKYNCFSNKYTCFVCYPVLKKQAIEPIYKLPKISDSVCCRIPVDLFGTLKLVWKLDFYSHRNSNWTFGEIIGVLLWTEISLPFRFRKITDQIQK